MKTHRLKTEMTKPSHPNILVIMVDEMRMPRTPYEDTNGVIAELRPILGFDEDADIDHNLYSRYFPGLIALRNNAVAFRNHSAASCACNPSRAAIFTGQYSSRTGVAQTDGAFKDRNDPNFPWLAPNGTPTMGDWFRAAGYETHYFGKWHVSNPVTGSLEPYGFSDWQLSLPEAQGYGFGNLGVYRDIGFADLVTTFLDRRALGSNRTVWRSSPTYVSMPPALNGLTTNEQRPWLAVASLVNPHDITGWPLPWAQVQFPNDELAAVISIDKPLPVPGGGTPSQPPPGGTYPVPLNAGGFPTTGFSFPSPEELLAELELERTTKPIAHYESALKVGLTFRSMWPAGIREQCPLPMQWRLHTKAEQDLQHAWWLAYGNFYTWFQYLVDQQIARIMDCLEQNGLRENTVVAFCADHGEYAGVHGGMLQKWYTAYDEAIHVPFVISAPQLLPASLQVSDQVTSHVDILPTLLGIAGYGPDKHAQLAESIHGKKVDPLPGADLSPLLLNPQDPVVGPDGREREGVLFTTTDQVTAPLYTGAGPTASVRQRALNRVGDIETGGSSYLVFLDSVEQARQTFPALRPGPVCQPNTVQCVRTSTWKLARYWDASGHEGDQWELYAKGDDHEGFNLVDVDPDAEGQPSPNQERVDAFAKMGGEVTLKDVTDALPGLVELLRNKLREAGFAEDALPPA